MTQMQTGPAHGDRRDALAARVRAVFADVAGFEIADDEGDTRFVELGMDSLMLTQVALQLRKAFQTQVTFRQLMEDCATVDRLVAMLDAALPSETPAERNTDAAAAPPAPAATTAAAAPPSPAPAAKWPAAESPGLPASMSGGGVSSGSVTANGAMALDADTVRALVDLQSRLMAKQLALLSQANAGAARAALHHDGEQS